MKLYRAMMKGDDGLPVVGRSSRRLGVRTSADVLPNVEPDVTAIDPDDIMNPASGGISTAPNDVMNLPPLRLPVHLGGRGRDPVWYIDASDLGPDLTARQDSPTHAMIEPSRSMTLAEYEAAITETRAKWSQV
jgi:hypothetical protein